MLTPPTVVSEDLGPAARPPGTLSQPGSLLPSAAPGHQLPQPPGSPLLSPWWADPAMLGDGPGGTGCPPLTPSLGPVATMSEEQLSPMFHPIPAASALLMPGQKWNAPNPLTKTQPHMPTACPPRDGTGGYKCVRAGLLGGVADPGGAQRTWPRCVPTRGLQGRPQDQPQNANRRFSRCTSSARPAGGVGGLADGAGCGTPVRHNVHAPEPPRGPPWL